MRVALFIDGKNFYSGWRDTARGKRIDFAKLSSWLVEQVGGTTLWGAHYYTPVEEASPTNETQQKLAGFLDMLETQPGFYVYTFKRRVGILSCLECGAENKYFVDKEVEISMLSHMLKYAAMDAFDAVIMLSGEADSAKVLESIRSLGKQAYIASWGGMGVSKRVRRAAYDHIDMLGGLATFERAVGVEGNEERDFLDEADEDVAVDDVTGDPTKDAFLAELRQAEDKFSGGYVGLGYFLTRWRSAHLDGTPENRRQILDQLLEQGLVETYNAPDGALAIRVSGPLPL